MFNERNIHICRFVEGRQVQRAKLYIRGTQKALGNREKCRKSGELADDGKQRTVFSMHYNNKGSKSLVSRRVTRWSCTYTSWLERRASWSETWSGHAAGVVSSMEWWAIYHEWRSFIRIQHRPTASRTCHCVHENRRLYGGKVYDLAQKNSDTSDMTPTGGDVYLSFFRPRSLESFLKGISLASCLRVIRSKIA